MNQPWITSSLTKCCGKESRLHKLYKRFPNGINKYRYISYRNTLKSSLRQAEQNYYQNEFQKLSSDMRMTWRMINNVLNKSANTGSNIHLNINGTLTSDPIVIVRHFNDQFVHTGQNLAAKIHPTNKSHKNYLPASNLNTIVLSPRIISLEVR